MRNYDRVYQITRFGMFMRYLRHKNKDSVNDMVEKLDIGRSHLAQVELGIRNTMVPLHFVKRINETYSLTPKELKVLKKCIMRTNNDVKKIDFSNVSNSNKQKILSYAYNLMLGVKEGAE